MSWANTPFITRARCPARGIGRECSNAPLFHPGAFLDHHQIRRDIRNSLSLPVRPPDLQRRLALSAEPDVQPPVVHRGPRRLRQHRLRLLSIVVTGGANIGDGNTYGTQMEHSEGFPYVFIVALFLPSRGHPQQPVRESHRPRLGAVKRHLRPVHETPPVLAAYAAAPNAYSKSWHFLTGTLPELRLYAADSA
jgi:hypothetical protein